MVDIETIDTAPSAVILSIGAVEFGRRGVRKPFYRSIEIFSSLMAGGTVNPHTVDWWRKQPAQAQWMAQPMNGKVVLGAALEHFAGYVQGADEIWAKGPDFDLVILAQAYRVTGRRNPWSYRNSRDCRTIYALSGVKEPTIGVKHSAVDDARAQALAVIAAYKGLGLPL